MLGTLETTSIPTNAASTNTVRYSTMPVLLLTWANTVTIRGSPSSGPPEYLERRRAPPAVPSRSTHMPDTISSSQSGATVPSVPISASTLATLRAYRKLAWVGMPDGGLAMPTMCTPWCSTTSPASVSAQLPPESAAMSTTTAPSAMPSTISAVTRIGAARPGTAAVVMTTSEAATSPARAARWRSSSSSESSRAYPPAPSALTPMSTKVAPEALGLLLGRGAHVVGLDHGAETARRGDGLQPGHADPHDQHLGRGDGARRRHEHREELGQVLGAR